MLAPEALKLDAQMAKHEMPTPDVGLSAIFDIKTVSVAGLPAALLAGLAGLPEDRSGLEKLLLLAGLCEQRTAGLVDSLHAALGDLAIGPAALLSAHAGESGPASRWNLLKVDMVDGGTVCGFTAVERRKLLKVLDKLPLAKTQHAHFGDGVT